MSETNTVPSSELDLSVRWAAWSDGGYPASAASRLAHLGLYPAEALATLGELTTELGDLLEHHDPASAVDRFLAAAEDHEQSCDRRATVRVLERLTPLHVRARPWNCIPHEDRHLRRRLLTPLERGLVRHCARATNQRVGVVGLLDSGASTGELGRLAAGAIVTTDDTPEAVDLPGTGRTNGSGYPEARARRADIQPWARPAIAALAAPAGDAPILYGGRATHRPEIQSAVAMVAHTVLRHAGLHDDPTVKPMSIRNTFGRAHYDEGGDLLATADALGHDDLQFVAREIGLRPHRRR